MGERAWNSLRSVSETDAEPSLYNRVGGAKMQKMIMIPEAHGKLHTVGNWFRRTE